MALVALAFGLAGIAALVRDLDAPSTSARLAVDSSAGAESIGFHDLMIPPRDVAELVAESELIVVGRVGPIIRRTFFNGYDEQRRESVIGDGLDFPWVDYRIDVERVFKDDGAIASGRPVILRGSDAQTIDGVFTDKIPIPTPRPDIPAPMARPGDRYLYFLAANPDRRTYYAVRAPFGRLLVEGPVIRASDGRRTALAVGGREVSPAAFMRAVEDGVREQRDRVRRGLPAVTPIPRETYPEPEGTVDPRLTPSTR